MSPNPCHNPLPIWRNIVRSGVVILGLVVCVLVLSGFQQDLAPYLVEVVVYKRTDPQCIKVMEIWSDRTTKVRCIGVGEREDNKCGPSAHCTSPTVNCGIVPSPVGGATCDYCTAGTANTTFCWPVDGIRRNTTVAPRFCKTST